MSNFFKFFIVLGLFLTLPAFYLFAQVGINTDNSAPNSSAMLDVKSTSKGFLPPRMTYAERKAIASPAEGLVVICTNCNADGTGCISMYLGGNWLNLSGNCTPPASPLAGIQEQLTGSIVWHWNATPIADGYKWNFEDNYQTAYSMGLATSKTETYLTPGTSYNAWVWAYNSCGHSAPTLLTAQALSCGTSFTIIHTAGTVAPVTKTVTYGTVTNIPGETSKCWITRNLGATQPPNTVSDNTEAAAGWYWQFNRMQGYVYDVNTRTPSTLWINPISESSDWTAGNDPCSLLLGNAWRIPTFSEWNHVAGSANWTNWNGPFSSGLQMHAAGFLFELWGIVSDRGISGHYWSSVQGNMENGWILNFNSGSCIMNTTYSKATGASVRCIRN